MIHSNDDYILLTREPGAVIANGTACSLIVPAAMKPHHNRPLSSVIYTAGPDIEVETVLACIIGLGCAKNLEELSLLFAPRPIGLWRVMAKLKRVTNACPGLRRLGRHKAVSASSGRAVGNSFESVHAVNGSTAHFSCARRNRRADSTCRRSQTASHKIRHECARSDATGDSSSRRQENAAIKAGYSRIRGAF